MRRGSLIAWMALTLASACGDDGGDRGSPGEAAGADIGDVHDTGATSGAHDTGAGGAERAGGSRQGDAGTAGGGDGDDTGAAGAAGGGVGVGGSEAVDGSAEASSAEAGSMDARADEADPNDPPAPAEDAGVGSGTGAAFDPTNPGPIMVMLPDLACQAGLLSPTAEDSPECERLTMCTELLCYPQLIGCFSDDPQSGALGGPCQAYAECASNEADPCAAGCKLDNACLNCFVTTLNRCYINDCAGQFESCIGTPFPTELASGPTCAEVEACCATQTDPSLKAMCEGVVAAGLDLNCASAAAVVCVD